MIVVLAGCVTTQPYYQSLVLSQPPLDEGDRAFLVSRLSRALRSGKVREISLLVDGQEQKIHRTALAELPLPALGVAWGILDDRSFRGAEWDAVIRLTDGTDVPVTAWWEPDRSLSLEVGATMSQDTSSGARLQERFGIGALQEEDRRWTEAEQAALAAALSLLTEAERTVLAGVPFRRQRSGVGDHAAHYIHENGQVWIQLYDVLFLRDGEAFRGSVSAPRAPSAMGILHEVGHAIASYPSVRAFQRHSQAVAEYNALVDELHSLREEQNPQRLEGLLVRLEAARGVAETVEARLLELEESPILSAFVALREHEDGPTPYGRTDAAESFAEAFALYRVDPQALVRIYPSVARWFSSHGHMAIVEESIRGF